MRGVDQNTSSSSSEIEEGMLKQRPSGDLDGPAPGEGVKGVAAGFRGLDRPSGELSSTGALPSRRGGGGGESPIRRGVPEVEAGARGGGRRDRSGHRRGSAELSQVERETRDREESSTDQSEAGMEKTLRGYYIRTPKDQTMALYKVNLYNMNAENNSSLMQSLEQHTVNMRNCCSKRSDVRAIQQAQSRGMIKRLIASGNVLFECSCMKLDMRS